MLKFTVHGIPRPQGSKRGFYRNGRVVLVEASKQLPEWRRSVVEAAKEAIDSHGWNTVEKACVVEVTFFMPKPKSVKRDYPIVAPDLDKCVRAIFDCLTYAKVVADDAVVTDLVARKRYADIPGCVVSVIEL